MWHKPGLGIGGDPDVCWRMDWELVQVANNPPLEGGRDSGVLSYTMRPADFWAHPAQKPVSLMEYIVGKIPGEPVLDPFMGSGTTLVAAKNLGRKSIGIEIKERYCEIAAERLSQGVLDLGVPHDACPARPEKPETVTKVSGRFGIQGACTPPKPVVYLW